MAGEEVLLIRRSLEHLEHGELSLVHLLAAGLDHQLVTEAVLHAKVVVE